MLKKIDFNSIDIDKRTKTEIEEDIRYFDMNLNKVDNIQIPDLDKISKKTMKKVVKERNEFDKVLIVNIIILFLLVGSMASVYNPALTYKVPTLYKFFTNINESLNIDFIVSLLSLDKVIPKVDVNESGNLKIVEDTGLIKEEFVKAPNNQKEALDLIHSLANTIIKAQHKWGSTEVTPKTIEIALKGVELIDDEYHRLYLRNALKKWSEGDFSNGVELHNYVWDRLDGSIGIAEELDELMIDKIIKEHFKSKENEKVETPQ
ncbi:hypothetical protein EAI30_06760 [Romboutsia ilealis]|uniref:Uncharacterized protein n=1 Tax=Romboutsia faecis TaxID=2764597 RepID=A0ABR7JKK0_9FIRM|nr:DUF6241 domain-containing protein [Romboutsia faecis]MBC5995445.1 hypothetical protein [Romboutsia faecis]MRN24312.1 hypothetical protein [Romboutsia ilealis]